MTWSVLTLAALTNGFNPCGIGLSVMFLSYLLVFGKVKRLGFLGVVYIGSVLLTYVLLGLVFYNLAYYLQRVFLASYMYKFMAGAMFLIGGLQYINVCWPESGIRFRTPDWAGEKILQLAERSSFLIAMFLGVVVTAVGTPCMMPLYMGMVTVLISMDLPVYQLMVYFLYYNLILVLPMIGVFLLISGGKRIVMIKELEHRYGKILRLLMVLLMLIVGIWLWGR
jgi:cytochrome c biogenesis protein CcdA